MLFVTFLSVTICDFSIRERHLDQGAAADNKRLGPVLAMIRDQQLRRGPQRRSEPRRRDQRDARLFKVG